MFRIAVRRAGILLDYKLIYAYTVLEIVLCDSSKLGCNIPDTSSYL